VPYDSELRLISAIPGFHGIANITRITTIYLKVSSNSHAYVNTRDT